MLPFLPETSSPNILYKRAVRLRAATGKNYRSKAELVKLKPSEIAWEASTVPVLIPLKDPAIGFVAIYSALVYGTYYSFFEAFPIVFPNIYGFGLGGVSLIFWVIVIGCLVGTAIYCAYLNFHFIPLIRRQKVEPERYLTVAFRKSPNPLIERFSTQACASCCRKQANQSLACVYLLPVGLFIFAWTSRESIHWMVPTIGIGIFAGTSFIFFQCIICYIGLAYPDYVASLFAGNDFVRSMWAAGFVMFSTPMYHNLGIGRGVSLLGGLSVMGVLGLHYLYSYGAWMRSKSTFAVG
jgi:MFS transporter, DHA1 family, multidrug resistance protein